MATVPTIKAVDLFCGAGGLTCGLEQAGIEVLAGVDVNGDCAYAYEVNNESEFVNESVSDLSAEQLTARFGEAEVRLLCGCAPCQTFSSMNQKGGASRRGDARWTLLLEFARLVRGVLPELVTMENVPGLARTDVFEEFVNTLKGCGYAVSWEVVDCSELGMPQGRRRLVLVASKLGPLPERLLPPAGRAMTVRDAIAGLPPLAAGETFAGDSLHSCSRLSPLNMRRIRSSVPGGTWQDWPSELRSPCHNDVKGDGYGAVYGRMEWDRPSPTVTTQFYNYGSGRFGHPEQDRALSLREGAILQGFPRNYAFEDPAHPLGRRKLGTMIGNAVPVGLGKAVGDFLARHVEDVLRSGGNDKGVASLS